MKQVWGHGKPSFLVKQETVRNVSETIINVQQLLAHRWKNTDKSAQLENALNAHVAQLVEAMVLETIQWKFESFHEHQMRVSYNGYYRWLPTIGLGFDSLHPHQFTTLFVYWLGYLVFTQEKRDRNSHRVPIMTL